MKYKKKVWDLKNKKKFFLGQRFSGGWSAVGMAPFLHLDILLCFLTIKNRAAI